MREGPKTISTTLLSRYLHAKEPYGDANGAQLSHVLRPFGWQNTGTNSTEARWSLSAWIAEDERKAGWRRALVA